MTDLQLVPRKIRSGLPMRAIRREEEHSAHSGGAREREPHASTWSLEGDTDNRYDGR
jgi:hypothetical protein